MCNPPNLYNRVAVKAAVRTTYLLEFYFFLKVVESVKQS